MKISLSPNIIKLLFFYIFSVLYLQIIELALPFSITKFILMIVLMVLAINILRKKYKAGALVFLTSLVGSLYLCIYFFTFREIISYVYPPVMVAAIGSLLLDNSQKNMDCIRWDSINKFIFIYILINIIFFILRINACFQDAGVQQFKGFLPHTNMLGAVLVSLYLVIFWQKGMLAGINKCLIVLLILGTYSRTFIALTAMLVALQLIGVYRRKLPFMGKLMIGIILLILMGYPLFKLMVTYVPALARFRLHGFTGNGRQYLSEAYWNTIKGSNLKDLILGTHLPETYLKNIQMDFPHSFTENSYMGITLMFGLAGAFFFLAILCRIFKQVRSAQAACVVIVCMTPLLMQDMLLSVQTGILYVFSVLCVIYQDPKRQRHLCSQS